uniref:Uncharacterized protein n=1 Tax=viral metagenome TaxID=1070528 RepID=A0A2V0RA95_9ZZZZ
MSGSKESPESPPAPLGGESFPIGTFVSSAMAPAPPSDRIPETSALTSRTFTRGALPSSLVVTVEALGISRVVTARDRDVDNLPNDPEDRRASIAEMLRKPILAAPSIVKVGKLNDVQFINYEALENDWAKLETDTTLAEAIGSRAAVSRQSIINPVTKLTNAMMYNGRINHARHQVALRNAFAGVVRASEVRDFLHRILTTRHGMSLPETVDLTGYYVRLPPPMSPRYLRPILGLGPFSRSRFAALGSSFVSGLIVSSTEPDMGQIDAARLGTSQALDAAPISSRPDVAIKTGSTLLQIIGSGGGIVPRLPSGVIPKVSFQHAPYYVVAWFALFPAIGSSTELALIHIFLHAMMNYVESVRRSGTVPMVRKTLPLSSHGMTMANLEMHIISPRLLTFVRLMVRARAVIHATSISNAAPMSTVAGARVFTPIEIPGMVPIPSSDFSSVDFTSESWRTAYVPRIAYLFNELSTMMSHVQYMTKSPASPSDAARAWLNVAMNWEYHLLPEFAAVLTDRPVAAPFLVMPGRNELHDDSLIYAPIELDGPFQWMLNNVLPVVHKPPDFDMLHGSLESLGRIASTMRTLRRGFNPPINTRPSAYFDEFVRLLPDALGEWVSKIRDARLEASFQKSYAAIPRLLPTDVDPSVADSILDATYGSLRRDTAMGWVFFPQGMGFHPLSQRPTIGHVSPETLHLNPMGPGRQPDIPSLHIYAMRYANVTSDKKIRTVSTDEFKLMTPAEVSALQTPIFIPLRFDVTYQRVSAPVPFRDGGRLFDLDHAPPTVRFIRYSSAERHRTWVSTQLHAGDLGPLVVPVLEELVPYRSYAMGPYLQIYPVPNEKRIVDLDALRKMVGTA